MKEQREFDLVVTIVKSGYAQSVMEAAKAAGASGGTVLSAKGTEQDSERKDIVMILVGNGQRQEIMQAIAMGANLHNEGMGISFSLPVDDVVGIVSAAKE